MNKVGVIGSGSFGQAIAHLLGQKSKVLMYSRQSEVTRQVNEEHFIKDQKMPDSVIATSSLEEVTKHCRVIFPVVSSSNFREVMNKLSPFLQPWHILIHGTKGLDVPDEYDESNASNLKRQHIHTMSEVISQETIVLRVGCLSGPNLASEILAGYPTGTVIASPFDEVIEVGRELLASKQFFVFGSHDIKGAELAGALKNIIAIGSGLLGGYGLGKNIQAMLITKGLHEIIRFSGAMGATSKAFLGTAGIADLVATATSINSRNYTFGYRMAKGETMEEILASSNEVYEGIRTTKIVNILTKNYGINTPILKLIYRAIYHGLDIRKGIERLMRIPQIEDVDFI